MFPSACGGSVGTTGEELLRLLLWIERVRSFNDSACRCRNSSLIFWVWAKERVDRAS